jgi:hypothetical protein
VHASHFERAPRVARLSNDFPDLETTRFKRNALKEFSRQASATSWLRVAFYFGNDQRQDRQDDAHESVWGIRTIIGVLLIVLPIVVIAKILERNRLTKQCLISDKLEQFIVEPA